MYQMGSAVQFGGQPFRSIDIAQAEVGNDQAAEQDPPAQRRQGALPSHGAISPLKTLQIMAGIDAAAGHVPVNVLDQWIARIKPDRLREVLCRLGVLGATAIDAVTLSQALYLGEMGMDAP
jgi:hypothetical protein